MSFSGSGVFVINSSGQPVVANSLIESAVFNAFTADIATGLSTCITKDGQTTVTANIPFSGFYATNVGVRAINGSVGTPGIAFLSNTDAGFYRIGADNIGLSIAGTKKLDIDATRLLVVEHLYFTDSTYDIGTSASVSVTGRPRDLWLSRKLSVPGVATLSNAAAVDLSATTFRGVTLDGTSISASNLNANLVGGAMVATQAQQETGSATNVVVTPGRQHFHPSASKCWANISGGGSPVVSTSYNLTSITDNGTGDWTFTIATDLSSGNYAAHLQMWDSSSFVVGMTNAQAGGTCSVRMVNAGNSAADPGNGANFCIFGDI